MAKTLERYTGRVRVVGEPSGFNLPNHHGFIVGQDPEYDDCYLIHLDDPAYDVNSGDELPVIREVVDNLRMLRFDRKFLDKLLSSKGLEPSSYVLFFNTGEGEFIETRPGYEIESQSGNLVTTNGKIYSYFINKDPGSNRPIITQWQEEPPQSSWAKSDEYQRALKRIEKKRLKLTR